MIVVLLVAAVLTGAVIFLKDRVKSQFANKSDSNIKSAQVTSGANSTTVYGSGRLADVSVTSMSEYTFVRK